MSPVRKYILRVAKWWVLVAVLATAGGAIAALWSVSTATTTWTATAALTSQSQERSPDQDGVLALGYVDYFNQDSYQQLLRAQANIPDEVSLSAKTGASSPILYIQASGPSEDVVRDAAATAAETFREDVRESLVTERRQAVNDLQAEIDGQVQELNSLQRTDVEKNVILDQIRSLQGRLTEFLADNTNHLKQLQPEPGMSSSTPSPTVDIVSGVAGGALLGILIALVMGVLDRRVHTAADVQHIAGRPVLAQLGRRRAGRRERLQNVLNGLSASDDGSTPMVAVAGIRRGDAASALAHELAAAWASRRGGALHVMADFRVPVSGYEHVDGFADVLQGRVGVLAAALPLGDGVRVIPPGQVSDIDPYAVAEPHHLTWALEEASTTAGLVVVEAPPVLDAPESQSICAAAQRVVLVMDGRRTRSHDLREAVTLLEAVGAQIAGIVVDDSGGQFSAEAVLPSPVEVRPAPALVSAGEGPTDIEVRDDGSHGAGHGENGYHDGYVGSVDDDTERRDGVETLDGAESHDDTDRRVDAETGDDGAERVPSPFPRDAMTVTWSGDPGELSGQSGSRDGQWRG